MATRKFVIDYGTSNHSFIKMYDTLRRLGVKNNKFFLKLYDPKLRGVNPHNENLSPEMKARILAESTSNPWYYLREVIRIPVPGGLKPFELHRGNLALVWCILMNLNLTILLPRQNYKTISLICIYTWIYNFSTSNTNMIFSNKSAPDGTLNLQRFKDITDVLPDYLQFKNNKLDINNVQYIRASKNNNTIKVASSPNSIDSADKAGRGMTTPLIFFDEFAFLKYNSVIYGSASPAQSQAMKEAENNGKPFGKHIVTTPNNLDSAEGKACKNMMDAACPFNDDMYDWSYIELKNYIKANSDNDFVHIEFTYKQLGRSDEWFETQCRALNRDTFLIKREILLEWTLAADNSPFNEDQLMAIQDSVKAPIGKIYLQTYYMLEIIQDLDLTKPYIIGVDVAGGLSRDNSAVEVIDPVTLQSVATFRSSTIDNPNLTMLLVELVSKYFPTSTLVIERNSYGLSVIQNLLYSPIAKNLYYEKREKIAEKKITDVRQKSTKKTETRVYGINTDKVSRDKMINEILYDIMNNDPQHITSKYIYENIKTLERKRNNKIEHRDGEHDDNLFAYLVARYVLSYGTNLNRFSLNTTNKEQAEAIRSNIAKNFSILSNANKFDNRNNGSLYEEMIERNIELANSAPRKQSDSSRQLMNVLSMNRNQ